MTIQNLITTLDIVVCDFLTQCEIREKFSNTQRNVARDQPCVARTNKKNYRRVIGHRKTAAFVSRSQHFRCHHIKFKTSHVCNKK